MSASWPGNMRGPWLKSPLPLLLLLLLLLTALTGKGFCQEEGEEGEIPEVEAEAEEEAAESEAEGDGPPTTIVPETTLEPDPLPTEDASSDPANGEEEKQGSGDEENPETSTMYSELVSVPPEEEQGLSLIIILIPVVLVVLIIGMIVCGIFINRRWNQKVRNQELGKEDPYLDGSSDEKVPMPMFEEDVPSVLELEMEELDQWMKKDGETAEDS